MPAKTVSKLEKRKHRLLAVQRNADYIRAYKEYHQCSKCGEGRAVCLDLHHIDPITKKFTLSDAYARSIKSIDAEMAKCIVVCANCHRLIHAGQRLEQVRKKENEEELLF